MRRLNQPPGERSGAAFFLPKPARSKQKQLTKKLKDYNLDRFNISADFLNSKWWYKSYITQISLYCYMRNKEKGLLHLRSLKHYKNIDILPFEKPLIDYIDKTMKKLKRFLRSVRVYLV